MSIPAAAHGDVAAKVADVAAVMLLLMIMTRRKKKKTMSLILLYRRLPLRPNRRVLPSFTCYYEVAIRLA